MTQDDGYRVGHCYNGWGMIYMYAMVDMILDCSHTSYYAFTLLLVNEDPSAPPFFGHYF